MAMAYNGFLALGKEAEWGTPVARTRFIRFLQAQFNNNPNWTVNPQSQSRYDHAAHPGPYDHVLNATIEVRADAIGEILRSLFWVDPATTTPASGTNARDHVFVPPASGTTPVIKPYTPELRYGTANVAEIGQGGWIDQATFQWDDRQLTAAIEMPTQKPSTGSPTGSPSYTVVAPFLFQGLTMTIDPNGTPVTRKIRAGSLQVSNGSLRTRSSSSRFLEAPEAGAFQAQLQFSSKMTDLQDLKDMWSDDGAADTPQDFCVALTKFVRLEFSGCEIEAADSVAFTADNTTDVITSVGHGLTDGLVVTVSSDDTLPAGLVTGTKYYIINKADDTFQLALTRYGSAVNFTDDGTGTHSFTVRHYFTLEFDLPAVMVSQASYPLSGKDEIVESLTLMGMYDDSTSKVVSARLRNSIASY